MGTVERLHRRCAELLFVMWCYAGAHNQDLEQYAECFIANDINGARLLRLTPEGLRDMGITSVGHGMDFMVYQCELLFAFVGVDFHAVANSLVESCKHFPTRKSIAVSLVFCPTYLRSR